MTGRATRWVWLVLGGGLALLTIAYIAVLLVDLLAIHHATAAIAFEGLDGIERIRIEGNAGSVHLTGVEGDTVRGEVDLRGDLWAPDHVERIEGDALVLTSHCPIFGTLVCGADYRLTVPAGLAVEVDQSGAVTAIDLNGPLDLDSSGGRIGVVSAGGPLTLSSSGGRVDVEGAEDSVMARSSGGSMHLTGLRGLRAELSSSGGDVSASFDIAPSAIEARTRGGGATILLPPDRTLYAVDARASGGDTTVDVRTDPTSERTIVVATSGGDARVVYRNPTDTG